MGEIRTLCDLYFHNVDDLKRPDLLMWKHDGQWWERSTENVAQTVEAVSCGLLALGVKPGQKVLLLSEDRPRWAMADFAILTAGGVTVPVYATLNAEETAYIARNSEAEIAFVSNEDQANKLLKHRGELKDLKRIIIFDPPPDGGKDEFPTWDNLIEDGKAYAKATPGIHRETAARVAPEDLATLIYTSGTTGNPKGVMLTHRNFVENCRASLEVLATTPEDTALVFLPLSHSFERMVDYCYFWGGSRIAYAESTDKVAENLQEVKPTLMASVPRLYEKVYARLMEQAGHSPYLKKVLIHWSVRTASAWAEVKVGTGKVGPWLSLKHGVADALVLKKLRQKTGNNFRVMISGGAPLMRELAVFFYGAGLPILEGYGLTESTPVISVNSLDAIRFGSIGRPISNVEVRIAEDGELQARGPNIMKGYYKLPEATAEVLTEDGWLSTGDIARQDPDGFLYITDRKKELLVTAGGKNVAPQPIENKMKMNKYVTQVVLVGDKRPYIAALIVPNWTTVLDYTRSKGVKEKDPQVLKNHPTVLHLFDMVAERVNTQLSRYEQIKRYCILPSELTQEAGELTPTLKVKRRVINERYAKEIASIYSKNGKAPNGG